jgi:hypothetical protein
MLKVIFLGTGLFQEDPAMGFAVRLAVAFAVFRLGGHCLPLARRKFLGAQDCGALVIYPTHSMLVRRPGTELEQSDASEVGARSGDNQ